MEENKMIEEDVIEEHNGVYDDKWHIVSAEGLDLPEGLEYLKNSWEGSWERYMMYGEKMIHKYEANIKVSDIPLGDAFKGLSCVLFQFRAYDTNLEIKGCVGDSKEISCNFLEKITYFAKDFFIHGCQLTFRDLASIMEGSCIMSTTFKKSNSYNLSGNVFTDKDLHQWKRVIYYLAKIKESKNPFKIFDLRGCNFSEIERNELMQKAGSLNLLI